MIVLRVGGRSTTVTAMSVNNGMYRVLASVSDTGLGGYLVDDILVDHFITEFQR